jgi:hypothetical protein
MAATDETLHGLNQIHGAAKPDDVGLGEWIWGALQGDFNAERSTGQIGFDMIVSLIPIVDTVCDVRDLCANIRQYRKDPTNKITLFFIATTVIGFFPELGTVVKSVLRLVWAYLKPLIKHADDISKTSKLVAAANRACDAHSRKSLNIYSTTGWRNGRRTASCQIYTSSWRRPPARRQTRLAPQR